MDVHDKETKDTADTFFDISRRFDHELQFHNKPLQARSLLSLTSALVDLSAASLISEDCLNHKLQETGPWTESARTTGNLVIRLSVE